MKALRERLPDIALAVAMAIAAWLWTSAQWHAFAAFETQWAHDLAFFTQILWSGSQGGAWASPLLLEPEGMLEMVHFHPVFWLLVPVYKVAGSPRLLLALNVLFVVSAAWPLARLGREVSGDRVFGALAGVAFLVWLPTASAAQADFRPMALMVPGFAWLVLGGWTRTWVPLLAGAALCLAAREESAYLLGFAGLVTVVRSRPHGAALLGIGAAWFALLFVFKGSLFFHFNPATFGDSVQPVPDELIAARWRFLGQALMSGYALAPAAWLPLGIAAPAAGFLGLDHFREWHNAIGPYVHLRSVVLPCFAAAGTLGAAFVVKRWGRGWALGLVMVAANGASFWTDREAFDARNSSVDDRLASDEHQALAALVAQVQATDRVVTDYDLIAAVAGRTELWNTVHLFLDEGRPPHWRREWPVGLERVDTILLRKDDLVFEYVGPEWARIGVAGDMELWRRIEGFPDCPDDMVPVPSGAFLSGAERDDIEAADWPETWNLPRPLDERDVRGFCIDRYEFPNSKGTIPQVYVTWESARDACASVGKRLCREDEWVKACAGEHERMFPYGSVYEPGRCHDDAEVGDEAALEPAGSRPGCVSAYGVYDLEGNASEWVADPHPNDPENLRVLRGGTMWLSIYGRSCMSRHAHDLNGPTHGDDTFRCCLTP